MNYYVCAASPSDHRTHNCHKLIKRCQVTQGVDFLLFFIYYCNVELRSGGDWNWIGEVGFH